MGTEIKRLVVWLVVIMTTLVGYWELSCVLATDVKQEHLAFNVHVGRKHATGWGAHTVVETGFTKQGPQREMF